MLDIMVFIQVACINDSMVFMDSAVYNNIIKSFPFFFDTTTMPRVVHNKIVGLNEKKKNNSDLTTSIFLPQGFNHFIIKHKYE